MKKHCSLHGNNIFWGVTSPRAPLRQPYPFRPQLPLGPEGHHPHLDHARRKGTAAAKTLLGEGICMFLKLRERKCAEAGRSSRCEPSAGVNHQCECRVLTSGPPPPSPLLLPQPTPCLPSRLLPIPARPREGLPLEVAVRPHCQQLRGKGEGLGAEDLMRVGRSMVRSSDVCRHHEE